jgi:4-hydroxybenzoate polyprenyltransferase
MPPLRSQKAARKAVPKMARKRSSLFGVLSEVFLKPRGILKMSQVWLPLALILLSGTAFEPQAQLGASLLLLYAVLGKGLSSILVNDLTDREIDRRAGKERWIASLPLPAGILIPSVLLTSGFVALIRAGGDTLVLASFAATALLGICYSLKPARFKERGVWGILAYSLSAAILNALVPWALFRPAGYLLPLLLTVILAEKLVQILFHQIIDFETDGADGIKSFAVTAGRERAARTLRLVLDIAVALDLIVVFFVLFKTREQPFFLALLGLACLLSVGASAVYVKSISKKLGRTTALTESLPWSYLGLSYTVFYILPPLLFFVLAWREPLNWVLVALSALSLVGVSVNYLLYNPRK